MNKVNNETQVNINQNLAINIKLIKKIEKSHKNYSCLYIFGDVVYVGTRSSKLYIYKLVNDCLEDQKYINPHCQIVSSVIANEKYFITIPQCDQDSQISLWQVKDKMFFKAFKGHRSQISKVILLKDQKRIATASWDGTVRIWSLIDKENDQHQKIYKGTYPILEIQQINQSILVFGGDDCYLIFWNWRTQDIIQKLFGHAGSVTYTYVFFPYLLTCGGDNKFKIWNFKQQLNQQNQQHQQKINKQFNYKIKLFRQDKIQYDSNIFCLRLSQNQIFLIDRQGQSFYCNLQGTTKLKNQFEYNQNITGISKFSNLLLLTTTKGVIKIFQLYKNISLKDQIQLLKDQIQLPQQLFN